MIVLEAGRYSLLIWEDQGSRVWSLEWEWVWVCVEETLSVYSTVPHSAGISIGQWGNLYVCFIPDVTPAVKYLISER